VLKISEMAQLAGFPVVFSPVCATGQLVILEEHLEESRKKVKKLEGKWVWLSPW